MTQQNLTFAFHLVHIYSVPGIEFVLKKHNKPECNLRQVSVWENCLCHIHTFFPICAIWFRICSDRVFTLFSSCYISRGFPLLTLAWHQFTVVWTLKQLPRQFHGESQRKPCRTTSGLMHVNLSRRSDICWNCLLLWKSVTRHSLRGHSCGRLTESGPTGWGSTLWNKTLSSLFSGVSDRFNVPEPI